jgi:hypothetical protein
MSRAVRVRSVGLGAPRDQSVVDLLLGEKI